MLASRLRSWQPRSALDQAGKASVNKLLRRISKSSVQEQYTKKERHAGSVRALGCPSQQLPLQNITGDSGGRQPLAKLVVSPNQVLIHPASKCSVTQSCKLLNHASTTQMTDWGCRASFTLDGSSGYCWNPPGLCINTACAPPRCFREVASAVS